MNILTSDTKIKFLDKDKNPIRFIKSNGWYLDGDNKFSLEYDLNHIDTDKKDMNIEEDFEYKSE